MIYCYSRGEIKDGWLSSVHLIHRSDNGQQFEKYNVCKISFKTFPFFSGSRKEVKKCHEQGKEVAGSGSEAVG